MKGDFIPAYILGLKIKRPKYGNQKTMINGITFDSKKRIGTL